MSFGSGGKGESQELNVTLYKVLLCCQNYGYCYWHSFFQKRMNYFTAVDISADFKFFSLVGFMNSEQIIFSTPFYYY
jgi:hypothetical protein